MVLAARLQLLPARPLPAWHGLAAQGELGPLITHEDRAVLFLGHTPADHAYFLQSGYVELFHSTADGRAVVIKILSAPALFGVIEAVAREPLYLESVRVLASASVHKVSSARFLSLTSENAQLANECLYDMGAAFCTAARFEPSHLFELNVILANHLVAWAELFGRPAKDGTFIALNRSQADLANAAGATLRSVNRILADWRDAGIMLMRKGRFVITALPALQALAAPLRGSLIHRLR